MGIIWRWMKSKIKILIVKILILIKEIYRKKKSVNNYVQLNKIIFFQLINLKIGHKRYFIRIIQKEN